MVDGGKVTVVAAAAATVVVLSSRWLCLVSTPSRGSWLGVVQTVLPPLLSMTVAVGCEDDDDVLGSC